MGALRNIEFEQPREEINMEQLLGSPMRIRDGASVHLVKGMRRCLAYALEKGVEINDVTQLIYHPAPAVWFLDGKGNVCRQEQMRIGDAEDQQYLMRVYVGGEIGAFGDGERTEEAWLVSPLDEGLDLPRWKLQAVSPHGEVSSQVLHPYRSVFHLPLSDIYDEDEIKRLEPKDIKLK